MYLAGALQLMPYTAKIRVVYEVHGSARMEYVDTLNKMNANAVEVNKESETSFLHCYGAKSGNLIFNVLLYTHFKVCMKSNAPNFKSLSLASISTT